MAFNIPVRSNGGAIIFNEVVAGNGSSTRLSVLLKSYYEQEVREQRANVVADEHHFLFDGNESEEEDDDEAERLDSERALHGALERLLDDINDDVVRSNIEAQVKVMLEGLGENYLSGFKQKLMAKLHNGGFDAGLCKTKWEQDGRCIAGDYEYIDINSGGTRYIVEVSLDSQFKIARPTASYTALLRKLPPVFVGKPDDLTKLVGLMCSGIKMSMKRSNMHMAPWRHLCYMQAQWFKPYKRTGNEISANYMHVAGDLVGTPFVVGFVFFN